MRDSQCVAFLQWMLPRLQMRWRGFRKVRRQVCKRIERRIRHLQFADVEAYRSFIETHAEEWDLLDTFCRISISRFYRDRGVFDCLRDSILPELAAQALARGDKFVRCWSAGCASGEEVYSLKLIWEKCVAPQSHDVVLRVVATDSDRAMLQRARRGCYRFSSLKELPRQWLSLAFKRDGELFCIHDEYRAGIEFVLGDVRREMPEGPFDLILCRNLVFTYFAEPFQREVLARMIERLVPFGVLVTGKQESLPTGENCLQAFRPRTGIYRKTASSG
ncbi:MAG TPA: CheR family methyltransferase [Pirellulales bacterium]|nr:CheR family methyltransferase [Pirellulales bacterium]